MYMETTDKDKESKTKIIKPQPGFQEKFVCSNVDVVFGGGTLNPQPKDCLVSTPNGFVKIGSLKAGDVITNPLGGNQTVNFVLDKGVQECVEFTLQDGRKVRSALSHHWMVKEKHGYIWDISAKDIIDYIETSKQRDKRHVNRLRIPMSEPVEFSDIYKKERKIHPYLLGVLIGDGCLSDKIYRADIGTNDIEVIERVRSLGYNVVKDSINPKSLHYCVRDKHVVSDLKELGLWGHLAGSKFIPDCYKYAPIEDRMELLRGLFDTDGCCSIGKIRKNGRVRYNTISERLAKDVQEVIWSIGGKCRVFSTAPTKRMFYDREINCAEYYTLRIWTKDDKELFHLERKKRNTTSEDNKKVKTFLSIMDYKILPPSEVCCINVSGNEHLYLTDNYVITRNCGKTFSAILSVAEPSLDPSFRACFTRRTFGELNMGGGLVDDFESAFGNGAQVRKTNPPRVTFPSGSFVEMRQINDENIKKITEQWKGAQFDLIYMDELTSYQFSTFKYLLTRNRGKGSWTGKFRGTTNPKKDSWIRKFLDWYISPEGQIIPERDGVVRYFYIAGDTIDDVIWGDTKKEVYQKCKLDIDKKIKAVGGTISYENFIKSFTFYLGRMSENKAILDGNMDYVGSVAASGGRMAQQLLEGNWNVDLEDESDAPIPSHVARSTFMNDPQRNGDRWITCDLADFGTDNMVALAWDGFHIMDALILGKTTPRMNADKLSLFAAKWDVADCHIIYDGINGRYLSDYIPDAIAFLSFKAPRGMYGRSARSLKDECYLRLKYIINNRYLSWEEEVLQRRYTHNKMKDEITIGVEFVEECTVVRFKTEASGKHRLATKKEMNQMLGKGRSMDLLDPCAMRMYPVLEYQYGDELIETAVDFEEREKQYIPKDNIYRDDFWA